MPTYKEQQLRKERNIFENKQMELSHQITVKKGSALDGSSAEVTGQRQSRVRLGQEQVWLTRKELDAYEAGKIEDRKEPVPVAKPDKLWLHPRKKKAYNQEMARYKAEKSAFDADLAAFRQKHGQRMPAEVEAARTTETIRLLRLRRQLENWGKAENGRFDSCADMDRAMPDLNGFTEYQGVKNVLLQKLDAQRRSLMRSTNDANENAATEMADKSAEYNEYYVSSKDAVKNRPDLDGPAEEVKKQSANNPMPFDMVTRVTMSHAEFDRMLHSNGVADYYRRTMGRRKGGERNEHEFPDGKLLDHGFLNLNTTSGGGNGPVTLIVNVKKGTPMCYAGGKAGSTILLSPDVKVKLRGFREKPFDDRGIVIYASTVSEGQSAAQ